jgi:hypothetical protein
MKKSKMVCLIVILAIIVLNGCATIQYSPRVANHSGDDITFNLELKTQRTLFGTTVDAMDITINNNNDIPIVVNWERSSINFGNRKIIIASARGRKIIPGVAIDKSVRTYIIGPSITIPAGRQHTHKIWAIEENDVMNTLTLGGNFDIVLCIEREGRGEQLFNLEVRLNKK